MVGHQKSVKVHRLIEHTSQDHQEEVLACLSAHSENERLLLVLDCSGIFQFNRGMINLMLSCLEISMKCKGDVRLAALPPLGEAKLRLLGMTELFELHTTTEGAVDSFDRRRYSMVGLVNQSKTSVQDISFAA